MPKQDRKVHIHTKNTSKYIDTGGFQDGWNGGSGSRDVMCSIVTIVNDKVPKRVDLKSFIKRNNTGVWWQMFTRLIANIELL